MRLWRDWSVRTRLAAVAAAGTALACVVLSGLVFQVLHESEMRKVRQRITEADLRVAHLIELGRYTPTLPDLNVSAVQVVDDRGRVVSSNARMRGLPPLTDFVPSIERGLGDLRTCEAPGFPDGCAVVVALRYFRSGGDLMIYGAEPALTWFVGYWPLAFLLGGSLLLTGAAFGGAYRIVRRSLAPVEAVRAKLTEITASDLSRRVPMSGAPDEIRRLAQTVNQTLERLQVAVERQRRFASDASHDLRSPITAMRAQVEEALLHPEEADWTKTAEALTAGLDRLQAIVDDLLMIARLDSGEKATRDFINLAELVRTELSDRCRKRRIVLDLQQGVVVSGNRLQLIRLLTNLLDNAERHAASTVTVSVRQGGDRATLQVVDDGEGIAPEQREAVFQRFTRLAAGRARDQQGTGLGLAIAREIAQKHAGTLTLEDSPKGARFVLSMPLLAVRPPEPARQREPG
ncbi:HAMP domain-containing sensor histidine kinase [Sphaerisporangium sp. TRM90804]|uniref:sensor histidine kinase n=1 Tax=Sphaerisporangium sp. TRM90804 TaxID=3031113 RepID=UPI00244BE65D|nr:HAMP domain-containing sensor histidine kinase [Sphaerisporangium sp. TRM90804]MDH2424333.1 HAMP domain-containing sensor histidine kinase [Sphaerisporangium sp. TRM90804]